MSRELDAKIAEKVMGWADVTNRRDAAGSWTGVCHSGVSPYIDDVPHYSTDITAAWLVIERMRSRKTWLYSLEQRWDTLTRAIFEWRTPEGGLRHAQAMEDSAPAAICCAALAAVREQEEYHNE